MKNYNVSKNTKSHEEKMEKIFYEQNHLIKCEKCGITHVTLRKLNDAYYCEKCFNKL